MFEFIDNLPNAEQQMAACFVIAFPIAICIAAAACIITGIAMYFFPSKDYTSSTGPR